MPNKSQEILEDELKNAEKHVKVGGVYYHFKNPKQLYKIISLGVLESSDIVCVVYQAEYNKKLIFVRSLENWLKQSEDNVARFTLVK
jgi:hypothetical protein